MDANRLRRYKDKIDLISERIGDTRRWISGIDREKFSQDKKTKLATYKATQEIVEAGMDLCSMVVRDSKLLVKDDYSNIGILSREGIIDTRLKSSLEEANGLRNRLIHEYNTLSDEVAFKSIQNLIPDFERFVEVISSWLKENT